MSSELGMRFNNGKVRYSLIPGMWKRALAEILTRGAIKYAPRNWEKGLSWSDTIDSLNRHLEQFLAGERYDRESGSHHLGHVAWNALALMYFDIKGIGKNDLAPFPSECERPTMIDSENFIGYERRKKEGA